MSTEYKLSYTASEIDDKLGMVDIISNNVSTLASHTSSKNNPHGVTLSQLGVNASATELNFVDGVTSKIQDQIDALSDEISNIDTPVTNTETWTFVFEDGSASTKEVRIGYMNTETWRFTLEDGSVVTKEVSVK